MNIVVDGLQLSKALLVPILILCEPVPCTLGTSRLPGQTRGALVLLAREGVLRGTVVEIQRKRLFIVHLQNVFKSLPESDLILSGDRVARRRLVRVGGRRFITLLALTKRCLKPVALRGQHLLKKWGPRNIRFRGPVFELEAFLIRGCPVRRRPLRRNIDRDLPETSLLLSEM